MAIKVAVPKETRPGERRVALVPGVLKQFGKLGVELLLETGAGEGAGFDDADYEAGGVRIVQSRDELLKEADVLLSVQPLSVKETGQVKEGAVLISFLTPHEGDERIQTLCKRKVTSFAMELVPRITRAQSIDALSSQAAAAGYKAALIAAERSPRFFPMLTTAAGTIRPAKAVVVGAGVAGLQAIATCRRLGAQVEGYDVRPETKEQVESLGAKFIDTGVSAVGEGGYARELTAEEQQQQAEVLANHVANAHVVVTTAAIPGRPAPKIIDKATVERMGGGTVIVDMAAETGGNCEVTKAGKDVTHNGVLVVGPKNLPASVAVHTSEMYSKNLYNLLTLMVQDGDLTLNWDDQVIADTCLTHDGQVRHGATRERLEGGKS
ncbi:MAG: Re/Si-specific NAD(P)(+) transhydrogenase subunit alpha [Halorhodospira halophila]|uniref:Re/Si-specific NAD(P)(+) transhydrogenase subunit alpha n=1 Tax=Halorhodospira TaxID=85108 RepID=UPI001913D321|nr:MULTISPECIES: Re/Si-specific NAD(P)(+) transhydrogenase subunit alpha [Halorhodospira]MBK5935832.1 NAD(P) transhydrogenase subunit alpha [Halorhodospira halophila]MBK5944586.1 NAD(P) transhydrogenase subunit alpha [Halorhodospira halophila]MCC3751378.1 Re/Si-specific NAD(P)(+) transhydrogenase subunit alpha [Halorhodospira halophila]MCG5527269.1 Re/Si-specific NAD(P)(+) transhydrogenase subunit alpha [Halorhodospira halophila]MCG5532504.1 Re/Si-specific NAD(P)(+) transhydrogenase subunit al